MELVATDNRAFELVADNSFINLAQSTLEVGKQLPKSHNLDISNLIPHPTTVSKAIIIMSYEKNTCLTLFKVILLHLHLFISS